MSGGDFEIIIAEAALRDIRAIYNYIALSLMSPETAKRQTDRIRDKIRSLSYLPERYAEVSWEPWLSIGMRKAPVDNYTVYYFADTDAETVTVVRVFYNGRNVEEIIKDCGR